MLVLCFEHTKKRVAQLRLKPFVCHLPEPKFFQYTGFFLRELLTFELSLKKEE